MNSHIQLRVSVNAVTSFLLMNLLLTGTSLADRLKTSFPHGSRRAPSILHLSAEVRSTPTQHMQRSHNEALIGIWPPENALSGENHSIQSNSAYHSAENDFGFSLTSAADQTSARRLLRDISPPGMWPPGSDAPPSERFQLFEFARRRALLSAADVNQRMESTAESIGKLSSTGQSILHDNSPGDAQPLEKIGRRQSLLLATQFGEANFFLKQSPSALKSGKSLLRDYFPPGRWPVPSQNDSPIELAFRMSSTAERQDGKNSQSFLSDNNAQHLEPVLYLDNFDG